VDVVVEIVSMVVVVVELVLVVIGGTEGSNSTAPISGAMPIIRSSPSKSMDRSSRASAVHLSIQGESGKRW
jgi:hypothetical protein